MAKHITIVLAMLTVLAGCSTSSRLSESWTISEREIADISFSDKYADVIVYHQLEGFTPQQSINFYIDTSFITSLREKRFRHVRLCPNEYKFLARFNREDLGYIKKHTLGKKYVLSTEQPTYLKIIGSLNDLKVEQVEESTARQELKDFYEQNHALARVRKINLDCSDYVFKKDMVE